MNTCPLCDHPAVMKYCQEHLERAAKINNKFLEDLKQLELQHEARASDLDRQRMKEIEALREKGDSETRPLHS